MSDFTQAQHGIQLLPLDTFKLVVAQGRFQHLPQFDDILQAVNHPGRRGFAVTTGPAGFLVVGFQALGKVQVGNKPDIRFVDAHAKGDGRHNDYAIFAQKAFLVPGSFFGSQAGVVGQCQVAFAGQQLGSGVYLVPGKTVNNAAVTFMFGFNKVQ